MVPFARAAWLFVIAACDADRAHVGPLRWSGFPCDPAAARIALTSGRSLMQRWSRFPIKPIASARSFQRIALAHSRKSARSSRHNRSSTDRRWMPHAQAAPRDRVAHLVVDARRADSSDGAAPCPSTRIAGCRRRRPHLAIGSRTASLMASDFYGAAPCPSPRIALAHSRMVPARSSPINRRPHLDRIAHRGAALLSAGAARRSRSPAGCDRSRPADTGPRASRAAARGRRSAASSAARRPSC